MHDTDSTNDAELDGMTEQERPGAVRRMSDDQGDHVSAESEGMASQRRSVLRAISVFPFAMPFGKRPQFQGSSVSNDPITDPEVGDKFAVSDILKFPERYKFEIVTRDEGEAISTVSGRVDGDDQFIRTEYTGGSTESYFVDGTIYTVTDDKCLEYPNIAADSERDGGKFAGPPRGDPDPKAEVTEITTVDGRETLVLELLLRPTDLPPSAQEAREEHAKGDGVKRQIFQPEVTYYVDVETSFLRRLKTESANVDYYFWGDVEPINPPDWDCREP